MTLPVFYIDTIESGDVFSLNEETSKHVVQVLRMKQGDELQLTDGKGSLLKVSILEANKRNCSIKVKHRTFKEKNNKKTCVAISLLKNTNRFEWFLEKAIEIGVSEIIPLICDRTEKQQFRYDRMKNIVIAAMIQSQQVWLPILREPLPITNVIDETAYSNKLIAHCEDQKKEPLTTMLPSNSNQILIGPEGDFTPAEIAAALSKGFKPVALGNTRLRTETAGVVAASFLSIY